MGACAHDQIYILLKSADVFVLPSYREAFGIAYLEAMASGLLAIGVESEGPSAFIKHGDTGFLVPPRDSDALARQLIRIAGDRPAMRKIAESGRDYVTRNLTWNRHAEKLIDIYRELAPIA
jgi:glycosyltransferase involved in cell wall biosynthesis